MLRGYLRAKAAIRKGNPGLFIPIDFGFVNIRLARFAKKQGWRVLYFMPPGSWRRDRQGQDLGGITDHVVTPFPWSPALLAKNGVRAHWWGHPICELLAERTGSSARELDRIAALPGSRTHELAENLPLIAGILDNLRRDVKVEFALAPSVDRSDFERRWHALAPNVTTEFNEGDAYGAFERAQAAIVCSGTATLEAALTGTPMVVIYGVPKSARLEARIIGFKRPKFIALPNIILDRELVPERAGVGLESGPIAAELAALMVDGPERAAQLNGFREIRAILGQSDSLDRTCELALKMLSGSA